MKRVLQLRLLSSLVWIFVLGSAFAQYQFPTCAPAYDPTKSHYTGGEQCSLDGINYQASYWVQTPPPSQGWVSLGACGDGGLGPDYAGPQRIIGYLPYWVPDYDIANDFDPSTVTHLNLAFILFQQNNNDFNSADFASVAWAPFHKRKVDSLLFDLNVLGKAHQAGVTVSVAIGGATDFAFIWLMERYYQNDAKLEEIANLIVDYVNTTGIDGVDLDLECWWPDPAIAGTVEKGGRVRGDKWGGPDQGPEPAAVGLTKLAQKLRQKMPTKLLSAAVFGTSWYGNNYDDALVDHLDWLGLMTYDFTGSWDKTSFGPHSALYTVPLNTYPLQSADNPIYSATDALDYWMGLADPAWNHDGGFNVPKAKLCIGVPFYGYDFDTKKPNNGNGYLAVAYRNIIAAHPGAATSYDPQDPHNIGGKVNNIYYNTPASGAAKINFTKNYGHQGVIIWELTQDVPYSNSSSILRAINEAVGPIQTPPVANITAPTSGATFDEGTNITVSATATDADGTVTKVDFYAGTTLIGTDATSPYSIVWNNAPEGAHDLKAVATDNDNKTGTSPIVPITVVGQPVLTSIVVTPETATIQLNATQQFAAQGYDQYGNAFATTFTWTGTDANGLFTGTQVGTFTVTATSGAVSGSATITVVDNTPVLTTIEVTPANASIELNATQQFAAQGFDQFGAPFATTFTWTGSDANGLFTGTQEGTFTVTAASGAVSGSATVTVVDNTPVLTSIVVSPATAVINETETQQYSAQGYDQFGAAFATTFTWSASAGTISTTGLYTGTTAGDHTVSATSGTVVGNATITVNGSGGCTAPQYVENNGYVDGSLVTNNGVEYQCKPYPFTGWCNGAAWAYAPGTGAYWTDAWTEVGPCAALKGAGVEALLAETNRVNVYPNPFSNTINFNLEIEESSDVTIKIYNEVGAEVVNEIKENTPAGLSLISIQSEEFPQGLYFFRIEVNNSILTGRILKK